MVYFHNMKTHRFHEIMSHCSHFGDRICFRVVTSAVNIRKPKSNIDSSAFSFMHMPNRFLHTNEYEPVRRNEESFRFIRTHSLSFVRTNELRPYSFDYFESLSMKFDFEAHSFLSQ